MGVSIAAYGAGLFHLMTHAFFKALLFMGAGSVIGAMAGHPGHGPHGRLPARDAVHVRHLHDRGARAGGLPAHRRLLLEGRDPRLHASTAAASTWCWRSSAYLGAFLTAFYAFRMVFRVFFGEPVPEARELEAGHLAHGDPVNPMTGEPEDTDVGFPGPEHHVAERAWPMKAAMAPLALLSIVGGVVSIPGVHRRAREVPRADLRGLALPRHRAHRQRRVARPGAGRRDLDHRHRARLVGLHPRARARPRACASATRGCTPSS